MRNRHEAAYERHGSIDLSTSGDPAPEGDRSRGGGTKRGSRHAAPGRTRWWSVPKRLRPRSVRAKIVSLLMVPVLSLMALWGYAAVTTAQRVSELENLQDINATYLAPVHEFVAAVQAERLAAGSYLAAPNAGGDELVTAAERTDGALTGVLDGVEQSTTQLADVDPQLPGRVAALLELAGELTGLRNDVLERSIGWADAQQAYSAAIDQSFRVIGALARAPVGDLVSDPRVVRELALAHEMLTRADAALAAAFAGTTMTTAQLESFSGAAHTGHALLEASIDDLEPSDAQAARNVLNSEAYGDRRELAAAVLAAGAGEAGVAAVDQSRWEEVSSTVDQELAAVVANAGVLATVEKSLFGFEVLGASGLAVALGLLGVVLSLLISVMIGRGLLVELVGLRNSAMDLAGTKLPAALRRVHAGESIDVDTETPPMPAGEKDEVTQVAEALNAVHRAALRAAVERAEVLSGISGVYVYLARRSQVLLHRQLALLDAMERRTEDPVELEDLFRLDHLTTRMRRLAESLIILSGTAPARRWRRPVPAIDVIRAAVAEIEDFTRVEVLDVSDVAITGQAIADLTHLLAELVENAVVFSPPHTKAQVRGELVGAGLVIEIEDRGLGMSREALADANRRIQDADQVDLLETDQLGLFVVNRLAHRQHIKVTLQRSPYGGVTAVVLIPEHLIDASRVRRDELEPSVTEPVRTLARDRSLAAIATTSEFPIAAVTEPAVPAEGVFDADAAPSRPEQADARTAAAPRTEPGVQLAAVPTPSKGDDPTGADDELPELPRRVRRAHLAPELRNGTVRAPTPPHAGPAGDERRTPERARDTLTAARNGWLRGQSDGANESEQGGQE